MCNLEHKLAYVTWCWNYVPKFLAYDLRHQVAADVALQLICLFAVVVFAQYLNCYRYNSKSLRCCVVVCTRISSWAWNLSLQWPFISTVYAKSKNSSYTGLCAVTFHIYCYIFLFFFEWSTWNMHECLCCSLDTHIVYVWIFFRFYAQRRITVARGFWKRNIHCIIWLRLKSKQNARTDVCICRSDRQKRAK